MSIEILIGFVFGAAVAGLALKLKALNRSGAAAAALTGGLIFGLGGLPWAALLLTFFFSSSILSRMFSRQKASLSEKFSKGSQRDWAQVLANGGLGAALVLLQTALPETHWPWTAYVGAMAAVNADTWATELGVLSRRPPRLLTTWRPVERGTSGGVSALGSLAALSGAALVAGAAVIFGPGDHWQALLIAGALGGLAGSFFDSLLGATVQAIYWCPTCLKETERTPTHLCGTETVFLRGWRWLDNDWVNFLASLAGALVCLALT